MFLRNLSFAGDREAQGTPDAIAMRPSRGRGVHWIDDQTRAQKVHLSDGSDDLLGDAWMLRDRPIFIGRAIVNRPRDLHRTAELISRRSWLTIEAHDRRVIVTRSPHDRGLIDA